MTEIRFVDTTLRDGGQSLWANNMRTGMILPVAESLDQAGFEAIELALAEARPGDLVLLAGKGHERYQILRDRTLDFDEPEIARRFLRERGYQKATR